MTTQTTYTVYSPTSGTEYGRGLTAIEAAQEILRYDGHTYELRRCDPKWDAGGEPCWQLYVSRGSAANYGGNRGMTEAYDHSKLIRVYADSEGAAWPLIAEQVIYAGWDGHPEAMTDVDYDAMLAEIARAASLV